MTKDEVRAVEPGVKFASVGDGQEFLTKRVTLTQFNAEADISYFFYDDFLFYAFYMFNHKEPGLGNYYKQFIRINSILEKQYSKAAEIKIVIGSGSTAKTVPYDPKTALDILQGNNEIELQSMWNIGGKTKMINEIYKSKKADMLEHMIVFKSPDYDRIEKEVLDSEKEKE